MTVLTREALVRALPYARRYARALTGSQPRGDRVVAEALQALVADPAQARGMPAAHALYRLVTRKQHEDGSRHLGTALSGPEKQLLLLTALEGVSAEEAATIVGMSPTEAAPLLADARQRLRAASAADVLIIEDEPIIAMDIEELVLSCGHRVIGTAASEQEAVDLAEKHPSRA